LDKPLIKKTHLACLTGILSIHIFDGLFSDNLAFVDLSITAVGNFLRIQSLSGVWLTTELKVRKIGIGPAFQ